MKCDRCGRREAVVYVKRVASGAEREARLCAECAASGNPDRMDGAVANVLSKLVTSVAGPYPSTDGAPTTAEASGDRRCRRCGSLLEEMLRTGHAGCASCWSAFRKEFDAFRLGSRPARAEALPYAGRLPRRLAAERAALAEIAEVRRRLRKAVATEDYETAARCRDRLRELGPESGDA